MKLREIYKEFEGEHSRFECKKRLERKKFLSWLKTVDGFANSDGGVLFVGVDDKGYDLDGMDEEEADKEKLYFYQVLKNNCNGPIASSSSLLPYEENGQRKYVLAISIAPSSNKPVVVTYDWIPMVFVRGDGFTSPATSEQIIMMARENSGLDYDGLLTDKVYDEADFAGLFEFYRQNHNGEAPSRKGLESAGVLDSSGRLLRAGLLCSDRCDLPNTGVSCTFYAGYGKGGDLLSDTARFEGGVFSLFRDIESFVRRNSSLRWVKKDDGRDSLPAYPPRALFEAVWNALAHRDYSISGQDIAVDLFLNRLCITSPGSFYMQKSLSPTRELSAFPSKRRNENLCRILVYCGAMESKGSGFEKIEDSYSGEGEAHLPFIYADGSSFTVVLPDLSDPDGVDIRESMIILLKPLEGEGKADLKILSYCLGHERTASEVAKHLGMADSSYLRKIILSLEKQGFLQTGKQGNATTYRSTGLVKLR